MRPNGNQPQDERAPGQREKARLIEKLGTTRRDAIASLRGVDDYAVVRRDGPWRVKDVLGHIASWEREGLAALQAFHEGDHYALGDDQLATYNQRKFEQRRPFDPAQIRIDWGMVRRELQYAIASLSPDRVSEPFEFPWGGAGTATELIEALIAHEAAHVADIVRAVQAAGDDPAAPDTDPDTIQ